MITFDHKGGRGRVYDHSIIIMRQGGSFDHSPVFGSAEEQNLASLFVFSPILRSNTLLFGH